MLWLFCCFYCKQQLLSVIFVCFEINHGCLCFDGGGGGGAAAVVVVVMASDHGCLYCLWGFVLFSLALLFVCMCFVCFACKLVGWYSCCR